MKSCPETVSTPDNGDATASAHGSGEETPESCGLAPVQNTTEQMSESDEDGKNSVKVASQPETLSEGFLFSPVSVRMRVMHSTLACQRSQMNPTPASLRP